MNETQLKQINKIDIYEDIWRDFDPPSEYSKGVDELFEEDEDECDS